MNFESVKIYSIGRMKKQNKIKKLRWDCAYVLNCAKVNTKTCKWFFSRHRLLYCIQYIKTPVEVSYGEPLKLCCAAYA